jgi:hypothetical protein
VKLAAQNTIFMEAQAANVARLVPDTSLYGKVRLSLGGKDMLV